MDLAGCLKETFSAFPRKGRLSPHSDGRVSSDVDREVRNYFIITELCVVIVVVLSHW